MNNLVQAHLPCPHCGSSDAYSEYTENFFCFSCKTSRSKKKTGKKIRHEERTENTTAIELPEDYVKELPIAAKSWLYGYHFDDDMIARMKIGYSEQSKIWSNRFNAWVATGSRVILPYFEKDKLKFFEGRDLCPSPNLKYISVGGKGPCYWRMSGNQREAIVIVEDIISAIRVGEVTDSVALRGTSFNAEKIQELMKKGSDFIVWLDSDKPGQYAARKLKRRLELVGCTVKNVVTKNDPKYYSNKQIQDILERVTT